MSEDALRKLDQYLNTISSVADSAAKIMSMLRALFAALLAVIVLVAGGIVWVRGTTSAVAQTQADVLAIKADRAETLRTWTAWQRQKDDMDVKTVAAIENLTRMLDYHKREIERLQGQRE